MEKLTESLEDYLEAVAILTEQYGHAHTKDIADRLHVKMPSVSAALRQLAAKHLIEYSAHLPVSLTSEGKLRAQVIVHRHHVLKNFFSTILGLPEKKASETACHLEHVVDEDTINRFVLFSEALSSGIRCPKGGAKDSAKGTDIVAPHASGVAPKGLCRDKTHGGTG